MPLGKQGYQHILDNLFLPDNHLPDFVPEVIEGLNEIFNRFGGLLHYYMPFVARGLVPRQVGEGTGDKLWC